jgi:hypothetical protein
MSAFYAIHTLKHMFISNPKKKKKEIPSNTRRGRDVYSIDRQVTCQCHTNGPRCVDDKEDGDRERSCWRRSALCTCRGTRDARPRRDVSAVGTAERAPRTGRAQLQVHEAPVTSASHPRWCARHRMPCAAGE